MAEWPKTTGDVYDDIHFGLHEIPSGTELISADLGRELYLALRQIMDDDCGRGAHHPALDRYEREVEPHASRMHEGRKS